MRKIRALVGLPVVVGNRNAGRVVKAELSDDLTHLTGLWIASGFLGTRFIASDSLGTLGTAAVIADHSGIRRRYSSEPLLRRAVGTDGSLIGAITGAEVDELSFRVEALELSCGVWDDLLHGRRRIRRFAMNRENGCVVIDVSETEKEGV